MDFMDFMDILWIYYSDFTVFFHNVRWRDFMDILWIYPPTNIWRWKMDENCTFADDLPIYQWDMLMFIAVLAYHVGYPQVLPGTGSGRSAA